MMHASKQSDSAAVLPNNISMILSALCFPNTYCYWLGFLWTFQSKCLHLHSKQLFIDFLDPVTRHIEKSFHCLKLALFEIYTSPTQCSICLISCKVNMALESEERIKFRRCSLAGTPVGWSCSSCLPKAQGSVWTSISPRLKWVDSWVVPLEYNDSSIKTALTKEGSFIWNLGTIYEFMKHMNSYMKKTCEFIVYMNSYMNPHMWIHIHMNS